jgi:hypothetical protein
LKVTMITMPLQEPRTIIHSQHQNHIKMLEEEA